MAGLREAVMNTADLATSLYIFVSCFRVNLHLVGSFRWLIGLAHSGTAKIRNAGDTTTFWCRRTTSSKASGKDLTKLKLADFECLCLLKVAWTPQSTCRSSFPAFCCMEWFCNLILSKVGDEKWGISG